jgi:hypothetical protein
LRSLRASFYVFFAVVRTTYCIRLNFFFQPSLKGDAASGARVREPELGGRKDD